jgi:glyoxylase-like metal-dependent hydrolase (beta-lactamase superfamily II)
MLRSIYLHQSSRRQFIKSVSASTLGLLARQSSLRAQNQPQVTTAFKELRNEIGVFTGRGGTMAWHASKEGVAVVDSMFPDMAKICLDQIGQRTGGRPVDYLLITHHHFDHTGGNSVFKPVTRKIVAHARVPELQKAAAIQQKSEAQEVYPDTTYATTWSADLGKEKIVLRHFGPAHTSGDSIIHFQNADIAHMGDLVFNRRQPYIDRPAGASIAGWMKVLEKTAQELSKDTLYIFGHAGTGFEITGKREDLLYQRDYFAALLDFVRAGIKEGKTAEAMTGITEPLRDFKNHGPLNKRVLQAAWDELQ